MNDRAVVLGAGIAGLLAARVLAETHAETILVDRDALTPEAVPRRGTPQARHLHGLLARGHELLEELFPGLTDELIALGAPVGDMLGSIRLSFGGHRFRQGSSGLTAVCVSRPTLESAIRRRGPTAAGCATCSATAPRTGTRRRCCTTAISTCSR